MRSCRSHSDKDHQLSIMKTPDTNPQVLLHYLVETLNTNELHTHLAFEYKDYGRSVFRRFLSVNNREYTCASRWYDMRTLQQKRCVRSIASLSLLKDFFTTRNMIKHQMAEPSNTWHDFAQRDPGMLQRLFPFENMSELIMKAAIAGYS